MGLNIRDVPLYKSADCLLRTVTCEPFPGIRACTAHGLHEVTDGVYPALVLFETFLFALCVRAFMQHFNIGGTSGSVEAQTGRRNLEPWGPREFGDLVDWEKKLSTNVVSRVLFRDSLGFFMLCVSSSECGPFSNSFCSQIVCWIYSNWPDVLCQPSKSKNSS